MIQIPVSEAAYAAIGKLWPQGTTFKAPERAADGRPMIWLPTTMLKALKPYRAAGEDWSAVILRAIAQQGGAQ